MIDFSIECKLDLSYRIMWLCKRGRNAKNGRNCGYVVMIISFLYCNEMQVIHFSCHKCLQSFYGAWIVNPSKVY